MGLTFAKYVIQPFFPQCSMPEVGVTLVAAATICKFVEFIFLLLKMRTMVFSN